MSSKKGTKKADSECVDVCVCVTCVRIACVSACFVCVSPPFHPHSPADSQKACAADTNLQLIAVGLTVAKVRSPLPKLMCPVCLNYAYKYKLNMPLSIRPSFALPSSLCLGVCLCMSEYVCVHTQTSQPYDGRKPTSDTPKVQPPGGPFSRPGEATPAK